MVSFADLRSGCTQTCGFAYNRPSMRIHYVLLLLLATLATPLASAVAAEQAEEPKKKEAAAPDAAKLERFLRRQNAWPASFQVKVGHSNRHRQRVCWRPRWKFLNPAANGSSHI